MLVYNNIIEAGFAEIPEFKKAFSEDVKNGSLLEDDGPYFVYGLSFVELFLSAAKNNNRPLLSKLSDFMEKMALSEDGDIKDLLDFGILEAMNESDDMEKMMDYLKPETLQDLLYMKNTVGYIA